MIIRDFGQSKIYKLYAETSEMFYIGSTCIKNLHNRLSKHKTEAKNAPSSVLSKFILDQPSKSLQIELVAEFPDFAEESELTRAKKEYLENMPEIDRVNCINFMKKYTLGNDKASKELNTNKKELIKIRNRVNRLIKQAESSDDDSDDYSE